MAWQRLISRGFRRATFGDKLYQKNLAATFALLEAAVLDQGVWAEIKVGGEHLRLFSEHNAIGVQASVYNVNAKNWIAPSELVEDIEQGKDRAEAHARQYLRMSGHLDLPSLEWKKSRSA
jgi:hypothetical protein